MFCAPENHGFALVFAASKCANVEGGKPGNLIVCGDVKYIDTQGTVLDHYNISFGGGESGL